MQKDKAQGKDFKLRVGRIVEIGEGYWKDTNPRGRIFFIGWSSGGRILEVYMSGLEG